MQVVSQSCTPTQFGADVVGLCGGVLLPTNVMKAITCQTCTGDICRGCSAAGIAQDQCKPIKNCASARRSLLQTAELKCSSAKVTINAASAQEASALTAKLESKTSLTDLGTCMGQTISSIGPNGMGCLRHLEVEERNKRGTAQSACNLFCAINGFL